MWADITKHLYEFESAVLSGLDEAGYPFSVRCRPYPGIDVVGLPGMLRFFVGSRRNAARYLKKRGLARPRVAWDEINAAKKAVSLSAVSNEPTNKDADG
jgi:hypothetical protein